MRGPQCRKACCIPCSGRLLFGFFLAASFVLAMPDTALGAKDGFNSFFNLFNNLPMPFFLKAILAIGIVVANYICALAGMTSTSRMIYAFSRDGGLPASKQLATIHPVHRTPVNAIWLTAALSAGACFYAPFMFALRRVVRCSSMFPTPYRLRPVS